MAAIEKIDVTLDQMAPNSAFLQSLASSPDPGIPYIILAGNTALIPAAKERQAGEAESRVARLLDRLFHQSLLHKTTALAFFGEPNDIAVSVASIHNVPKRRALPPITREVPCDHLSYFSTEASLTVLAEALA